MSIKDGGPAFPNRVVWLSHNGQTVKEEYLGGMTMRDYFAAKAMQAVMAKGQQAREYLDARANECYAFADAMLRAREVSHD